MDNPNQIGQDLSRYKEESICESWLTTSLRSGVGKEPSTRPSGHISISSHHSWGHEKREKCTVPSTVPGPAFSHLWFLVRNWNPAGRGGLQRSNILTFCYDGPNHVDCLTHGTRREFHRKQFGKLSGFMCIPACTYYARICGKLHLMQKTHLGKITY